jgi:hypothetical protein
VDLLKKKLINTREKELVSNNFAKIIRNFVTTLKIIKINLEERMKRKISIILSLILLVSTTGFGLSEHYCKDKLVDIFLLPHFGKCCNSTMPEQDDSCQNVPVEFLSDGPLEFTWVKINLNTSLQEFLVPESFLLRLSGIEGSVLKFSVNKFPSPPLDKTKIYLRLESFLN